MNEENRGTSSSDGMNDVSCANSYMFIIPTAKKHLVIRFRDNANFSLEKLFSAVEC